MGQQIVNEVRPDAGASTGRGRTRRRERSRGQVLVIFALSAFVFVGMSAVVIDVAWYWANTLRVQRAADAAALAGAVLLPGKVNTGTDNAYVRATKEATKNGYTAGGGVTVTPVQNSLAVAGGNPRELDVTITAPVPTFFMRVFGINSINATRTSKAEFVLPVPMGSPQNYYGVGEFLTTPTTTRSPATAISGWPNNWTTAGNADGADNGALAVSASANGSSQQWRDFGLTTGSSAILPAADVGRVELRLRATLTGSGGTTTSCRLLAELSWNGGSSWTNATVPTSALTTTETLYSLPDAASDWGSHVWVPGDFTDANFRVRLTWDKPTCSLNRTASVDTMELVVASEVDLSVNDPTTGSALTPQNFWGAIFTKGGVRQNGDYFAPSTIGSTASGAYPPPATSKTDANPTYLANGYDYTVDFTGSTNGQVRLFDPIFCATGPNTTSGWYGAGDHWTTRGSTSANDIKPVAVTYRLFDTKGTPYDITDDGLPLATLAYDPADKTLGDFSGTVGSASTVQNYGNGDRQDCSADPAHDRWVTLASGLPDGMYRVNVETSDQAANASVGAENLFAIWVQATGGEARVYGGGRMAGYTQVADVPQSFYLAQIAAVHAGKTLQIQLFDPGDVKGDAKLYIKSPDGNVYTNATFNWTADAACKAGVSEPLCSGTNKTYIQTAVNGSSSFDNSMITITIVLDDTYGDAGLTPPGVPGATAADKAGWWKIYYDVTNANDTTTWMVNILGNPVHLKVP